MKSLFALYFERALARQISQVHPPSISDSTILWFTRSLRVGCGNDVQVRLCKSRLPLYQSMSRKLVNCRLSL